jgi:flagellar hook protein FlgE
MSGDAFSISQSGLQGVNAGMQAVSDNLANAQTTAFNAESVEFSTLLGEFVAGNPLGGGVAEQGLVRDFSQGAISQTNSPTDLAIQGNGFFVLQDAQGGQYFSRNGQMTVSANGTLVGFNGDEVMGYPVTGSANTGGVLAPINIPQGVLAPAASTQVATSGNLDSTSPVTGNIATPVVINPADSTTYNSSVSVQVYDSLGNSHVLTYFFQNAGQVPASGSTPATEQWNWMATLDGSATGLSNNTGSFNFDSTGALVSGGVPASPLTATPAGASPLSLALNFSAMTQYATPAATNATADGNAVGRPQGLNIDSNGVVSMSYSNGQTVNVAQVAVATFTSDQGLQLSSNGAYQQSGASGTPTMSTANAGAAGSIESGALESSHVDTTSPLGSLVVLQRNFQADAKALQTEDNLLGTVVQITTS